MTSSRVENPPPAADAAAGQSQKSFLGDTATLAMGTLIAQVMTIVVAPVLTRLYSPDAFGALALYFSIVNIISETAALRYDLSIVLPETDEEAANQVGVSLLLLALVSTLLLGLYTLAGPALASWFGVGELLPLIGVGLLGAVSGAVFLVFNYWNTRLRRFGWLSVASVVSSLGMITAQLALGFGGWSGGVTGLVLGSLIGSLATMLYLAARTLKKDGGQILGALRWQRMQQGIRRYQKFPRYDLWAALLSLVAWQLPTIFLTYSFSTAVVGYFSLGMRMLQVPIRVIGLAIGQALYPRLKEGLGQNQLAAVTEDVFRRLAVLTLFPLLLLAIVGRDLFWVVFGPAWEEAGVYVQILSIWIFFWFLSYPLATVFSVLEQQEQSLKVNLLNFFTRILSFIIGGLVFQNARLTVLLFSVSGILVYGYFSLSLLQAAGVPIRSAARILGLALLSAVPFAAALLGAQWFLPSPLLSLLLAGLFLLIHVANVLHQYPDFLTIFRARPAR